MKTIYYPGWGVVWKIYSRENLKKSIWLPLVLTVVSFAICFFSGKASLDLIEYVASTILSVGPNMLGFTLSGYALMMGLSNSEFVRGLINFKEEGKDYSLFQSLNTICSCFGDDVFDNYCRRICLYCCKSRNIAT